MSADVPDIESGGLIIIRRRGGLDADVPKGGVWKIAFADFMTAMMAFFLVMWLINATDEETRAGVANYFNPVKLADQTVKKKGVRDPEEVSPDDPQPGPDGAEDAGRAAQPGTTEKPESGATPIETEKPVSEEALFRDPYAVLAEIAGDTARQPAAERRVASAPGLGGEVGLGGDDAYNDPFDPRAWDPGEKGGAELQHEPATIPAPPLPEQSAAAEASLPEEPPAAERTGVMPPPTGPAAVSEPAQAAPQEAPAAEPKAPAATRPPSEAAAADMRKQIADALHAETHAEDIPNIEVKSTGEGILISLTDDADFGMFAIGSAEPRPEVIRVMETIAELLAARPGELVIRGHTDGRPFKSESYDNWRLSTARAHMAYYMLVRGGLDEARVIRIEGYADRDLKIQDDPEAAENRRIDILLREDPA